MSDAARARYAETMAKLLEPHPDPIVLSDDIYSRWRADVKAWAAGDLEVRPARPPVRLGVTICSSTMRWGDGDGEILGTFKGGLVYAGAAHGDFDTGEIVEAWKVVDTHHGGVHSWVIDADDILDWNDGVLVYTGLQRWDVVGSVYRKVKAAAGKRSAPPWLDDAVSQLYGLLWRHERGGDDG